ncbi:cytochrome P450 [Xylariaceae sp. FL1272]|nr:cytochrome P450 [Xylariaceae sp. FL1272]
MLALIVLAITLLIFSLYTLLYYKRFLQYAAFPQLPSSLIFGHLKIYDEISKLGPLNRDNDHVFSEIHQRLGCPPLVLLDYRPICRPVVFIASYEIAEQLSRATKLFPTNPPKVDLTYLQYVTGAKSILSAYGENWKSLRRMFSYGFYLQNLSTLIPTIAGKTLIFSRHLDTLSLSCHRFSLTALAMNLTFDIIGSVIMDVDLRAQHIDPSKRSTLRRRRLGKRVDRVMKSIIKSKHAERFCNSDKAQGHQLSVLSIALKDTEVLSKELVDLTSDQLKTFLLAGHDSPSATIGWIYYELSRCPRALSSTRSEVDEIFGPHINPDAIHAQLVSPAGPELIARMSYTTALIKETLRLHTPASTARYSASGTGFVVHTSDGKALSVDDVVLYSCNSIIHRDPAIYGDTANQFVPERWLDGRPKGNIPKGDPSLGRSDSSSHVPCGAWRPFESDPRGCIGQEFAIIELRVIIAMTVRQYTFTKVRLGEVVTSESGSPVVGDDGHFKLKSQLYNTRQITARPVDGMMMTVTKPMVNSL